MIQSVFERSMPSDLIRGWVPLRVKKTRKDKSATSVLVQSKPKLQRAPACQPSLDVRQNDDGAV
jgi:hypothetical protein